MRTRRLVVSVLAIALSVVLFLVPFAFIVMQAIKTAPEASQLSFAWPTEFAVWENLIQVLTFNDNLALRAFLNSTVLTVFSVTGMVLLASMTGYLLERRRGRINPIINFFVLSGLIVPPAVVPTIWVLQGLGLFKTLPGLILIEITFGLSFCILLTRAFVSTIPKELDEAAVLDGAGPLRLFFQVVLPLLRPVLITLIVVQSIGVFNDFANPLYFLPGNEGATVQLTLFTFQTRSLNQYHLLFMDLLLITIPPLLMFIFFNRKIVAGMTAGSIKG